MKNNYRIISVIIPFCLMILNPLPALTKGEDRGPQDEAIARNRKGEFVIKGKPGSIVTIEQLKHEFWFGCAISSGAFSERTRMTEEDKRIYKEKFLENFNSAVTENAVKWGSMEWRRGVIDYQTVDNILEWTEENDIPCRGHNLYWGIEKFIQPWLKEMDDEELRAALKLRGIETAKHFKGRFVEYDLNNEMIHGNYFAERLGDGITKDMADWVHEGDPDAKLWVNDYDILTGNRLDDFIVHIRTLLEQGVPVAGIGVQGHLHAESFSREKLKESLDALGEFGLPIRITEFNMPGQRSKYLNDRNLEMTEEEAIQMATDLTDYYRICFAHPAVEGILMWGFWEGANWIKPSSLYKLDWSPTLALEAYQDLIFREWNTTLTITLDNKGEASVPAFYGSYRVSSGKNVQIVDLQKVKGSVEVKL